MTPEVPWIVTAIVVPCGAVIVKAVAAVYRSHRDRITQLETREGELHKAQLDDHKAMRASEREVYEDAVEREGKVRDALSSLAPLPGVVDAGIKEMQRIAVGEREHTAAVVREGLRVEADRVVGTLRECTHQILTGQREQADRILEALRERNSTTPEPTTKAKRP